jgi:hypothetical protein
MHHVKRNLLGCNCKRLALKGPSPLQLEELMMQVLGI